MKRVGHIGYEATDELCLEIPLFNYNDIDYPNFSENDFSAEEKDCIKRIQEKENK